MQAANTAPTTEFPASARAMGPALATVALVALADYLVLTATPGVSWFVFAMAAALVVAATALPRHGVRAAWPALGLVTIAALPIIEAPSLPGLAIVSLALAIAALLAARLLPSTLGDIPGALLRFGALAPFRLIGDIIASRADGVRPGLMRALFRQLLGWLIPLAFLAIFLWLFVAANPVFDLVASQISLGNFPFPEPVRLMAWLLVAAATWALLRPRLLGWVARARTADPVIKAESLLFGRSAILRSLIIFNAIFAIQTLMDLSYLWGGMALPAGMSHADYAHRGAFPLIVTALLAAAFVLAAMRQNGPGEHSPLIRGLVYAWIGQNILLCISAILRLNLYVEAYSLTELRVVAGIWMGLVAVGLLLILLRIVLRQSNGWLIATNLASLAITLWFCAWIDFPALIARFNVDHSREITGTGVALDLEYLLELGPTVIPAVDDYLNHLKPHALAVQVRQQLAFAAWQQRAEDWRGWTWRQHRLAVYLDSTDGNDNNSPIQPY